MEPRDIGPKYYAEKGMEKPQSLSENMTIDAQGMERTFQKQILNECLR